MLLPSTSPTDEARSQESSAWQVCYSCHWTKRRRCPAGWTWARTCQAGCPPGWGCPLAPMGACSSRRARLSSSSSPCLRCTVGKELEIRVWSKVWLQLTPNFPSYQAHCMKECQRKRCSYRLCRTRRVLYSSQSQLFSHDVPAECAVVSGDGKHNIVFSRSHPRPRHLTSFDLKFLPALPPSSED